MMTSGIMRVRTLTTDIQTVEQMVREWAERNNADEQGFSVAALADKLGISLERARRAVRQLINDGKVAPVAVRARNMSGRISVVVRYRVTAGGSPSAAANGRSSRRRRRKSSGDAGASRRLRLKPSG